MDEPGHTTLIGSLSQLADAAAQPVNSSLTRLRLFQPLGHDKLLTACRESPKTWHRDSQGNRIASGSTVMLTIEPVCKLWREARSAFPSHAGHTFVYDISLPERSESVTRIYWSYEVPAEGGLAVTWERVYHLVVLLATEMDVRSKKTVRFELGGTESLQTVMASRSARGVKAVSYLGEILGKLSASRQ